MIILNYSSGSNQEEFKVFLLIVPAAGPPAGLLPVTVAPRQGQQDHRIDHWQPELASLNN